MAPKPKPRSESKANPLTKGKARRGGKSGAEFVREASAILDEMERNPPSKESLAPFRTKNWIRKGEGMLAGLKPIACLAFVALVAGCLGSGDPARLDRLRVLDELGEINYQLEGDRDTRHSVERYRPDIWNRMFAD